MPVNGVPLSLCWTALPPGGHPVSALKRSARDTRMLAMTEGGPAEAPTRGEALAEISRGIVQLHRRYYGKGPTKAKTYAVNDTIICLLSGGFTTVEGTLIADGKADDVENIRRSFQKTMRGQFTGVVERATGGRVIGYMSQVHSSPNMAIELFVLKPSPTGLLGEHEEYLQSGEPV